ncbi:MAG: hypothetical protein JXB26_05990 [Candidatus Aminicenantes bacterium]|nr:hypothetical protein [Candidatus Aminicenantes bacterium]
MKKIAILIIILIFVGGTVFLWPQQQEQSKEGQQTEQTVPQKKKAEEVRETTPEEPQEIKRPPYDPGGRRDPFRNLLAGQEVKERDEESGEPLLLISEVKLLGIIRSKGTAKVVITGPEGFPVYISIGHRFADGYLHAIEGSKIIFRKTKEGGILLKSPIDIVKEF